MQSTVVALREEGRGKREGEEREGGRERRRNDSPAVLHALQSALFGWMAALHKFGVPCFFFFSRLPTWTSLYHKMGPLLQAAKTLSMSSGHLSAIHLELSVCCTTKGIQSSRSTDKLAASEAS